MTTAVEGKLGRRLGLKMYWMPVRSDNPNCLIKNGPHPLLMTIPSKYCQTFNRGILMRCCLRLLNDLTTKALADRGSQEAYGKFCLIRPRVSLWSKPMLKCESEAKPCPIKKEKGKKKKQSVYSSESGILICPCPLQCQRLPLCEWVWNARWQEALTRYPCNTSVWNSVHIQVWAVSLTSCCVTLI